MTGTGRLHEIRAIIEAAEQLPPCERAALLDERCAGDPQLRREVEGMLDAMSDDGAFLTPIIPRAAAGAYADLTSGPDLTGDPLPGFRVLRVIGEGGMGVVYEAQQERPSRRVALKVVRSVLPSVELLKRFSLESEVLGRLQHPGIAQIYEAGTYQQGRTERPFFAMELVDGQALTSYAQNAGLSTRERVEMLIRICEAIEHAHQKGVIHRDLKPSNILVNTDGQPKILDFGVARSTEGDLQMTEVGTTRGQIVGTLAYMSPEQLAGNAAEIDTRSDVYALGVIAYELFADRRPHDLANKSLPEAIRTVQTDEPPALGTLIRESRGDLSTIVQKAMEKDKDRRYQSASLLAADLTRFLRSEPILARPPTTAYRVRKFTSRNPTLVVGLASVFVVLVVGIIATSSTAAWALDAEAKARANAEEAAENAEAAERERSIADAVNEFLNKDLLAAADPQNNQNRDITMREVVDIASANIESRFPDRPLVEARIRLTLSETYQNLGVLDEAERHARIGVGLLTEHKSPGDLETVSYAISLATTLMHRGGYTEAAEILEPLLAERRAEAGSLDEIYLLTATNLGSAYMRLGRLVEAEPLLLEALEGKKQTLGETHERTLTSVHQLANLYSMLERSDDALLYFQASYEGRRETLGAEHPRTITALRGLGTALTRLGRTDEARETLSRAREISIEILGPAHPRTLANINAQAMNETKAGDYESAIAFASEAATGMRSVLGADHPETISYDFNLAKALASAGRHAEALPIFRSVEEREAETLPSTHWYKAMTFLATAGSLRNLGRLDDAFDRARSAFCIYEGNFPISDQRCQDAIEELALILESRGNIDRLSAFNAALDSGTLRALICGG